METVNTGIPQGSPLSPLLFIIYVKPLHEEMLAREGNSTSYVDDIQVTVVSVSWHRNESILEDKYRTLSAKAAGLGLLFSTPKTELIYWKTPREKTETNETPIRVGGVVIKPEKIAVKWLGFWFETN
jgi:hypothetical protein